MYKIIHDSVCDGQVKVHYTSTKDIAIEVLADLDTRFSGVFSVEKTKGKSYIWDPGGMLMTNDRVLSCPLSDIIVCCKSHHFNNFTNFIKNIEPRGQRTKYIKLHGKWTCVCLNEKDYKKLKALVAQPNFFNNSVN